MLRTVVMSAHSSHIEPPSLERFAKSELTSLHVNMTWCIFLGAILTNKPISKEFEIRLTKVFPKMVRKWFTDVKSHPGYRTWVENQGPGQTSTWDMDRLHWIWWSICGYGIPNFRWWLSSNLDLERRNEPSHQQLQIYHPKDKRHGVVVKAACNEKLSWNTLTPNPTSNPWHTGTVQNIQVLTKNPALVDLRISQSCCVGILSLWWMGFLVNFHCKNSIYLTSQLYVN